MERKDDANCAKACSRLMLEGTAPVGRMKKTWQKTVSADMCLVKVEFQDVDNRMKWTAIGEHKANPSMA